MANISRWLCPEEKRGEDEILQLTVKSISSLYYIFIIYIIIYIYLYMAIKNKSDRLSNFINSIITRTLKRM